MLTERQEKMLALFDKHVGAELDGDLDTTMATMSDTPHLHNVPNMLGGIGQDGVGLVERLEPTLGGLVARLAVGHLGPGFTHDARAVVADDVRALGQLAAGAVQDVAAFDANRLHVDHDAPRVKRRVRDVFVPEDVRRAGFVIHRCFHRCCSIST